MIKNLKRNWLVVSKLTWESWQILTRELKSLKNVHFNELVLTKLYNIWAKKYRWVMFDCTQDWYKVWRKTGLCFQKLTWGIWQIFTRTFESLQIGTLMAYFCLKLKIYGLKIYREVMYHENEEWCENWGGMDLSVQSGHEEVDEFWPKHSKISKFAI